MCYEQIGQDAEEKRRRITRVWAGIEVEVEDSYQTLGGGGGFKLTVFQLQLNSSYLHHNVKGVLVEEEHKKQTEKLWSVS